MNDWKTNENALLRGARSAPVGTPSGINDDLNAKFGTNRAGNSVGGMLAELANLSPSPKLTKWFCQATRAPAASTPPLR